MSSITPGDKIPLVPDVSVIVPCFNAADTVLETATSLVNQTHRAWEAVFVDDGSMDGTAELLTRLSDADPRMRSLRVDHRGLAATRNRGLAHARGERVLFLDADDLLRPNAIEHMVNASIESGDVSVVSGGYDFLDETGKPLGTTRFPTSGHFTVDDLLLGSRLSVTSLVPRRVLGESPFDRSLAACEDWDLWLRLADRGVTLTTLPFVTFGYRLRHGSLSHRPEVMFKSGCRVLERWGHRATRGVVPEARARWAITCSAVAIAAGKNDCVRRFLRDCESLLSSPACLEHIASSLCSAFLFVHGASGRTWADWRDDWLDLCERSLAVGPLQAHRDSILGKLADLVSNPRDAIGRLVGQFATRRKVDRLVVYGLGTNGLGLLPQIARDARRRNWRLLAADDSADSRLFETLGVERAYPGDWRKWPESTVVLVTPNEHHRMVSKLESIGGRRQVDFLVLQDRAHATIPEAPR